MTSNSLSAVEKKIKELVPEIVRSKFQCDTCGSQSFMSLAQVHLFECDGSPYETTILRREITLADVLKAIEKEQGAYKYAVAADGHFIEAKFFGEDGDMLYEGTGVYWNLTQPLSGQSKECLSFLASLLGK